MVSLAPLLSADNAARRAAEAAFDEALEREPDAAANSLAASRCLGAWRTGAASKAWRDEVQEQIDDEMRRLHVKVKGSFNRAAAARGAARLNYIQVGQKNQCNY